jgi:hypothetical protein
MAASHGSIITTTEAGRDRIIGDPAAPALSIIMQHTPGPYIVAEQNCGGGANVRDARGLIVVAVCQNNSSRITRGIGIDGPEALANARLFAAAPDLLALAQFVIDHPHAGAGMGDKPHAEWAAMQKLARAAIAGILENIDNTTEPTS